MRAEIGKKSIFPGIFPKGTVITLSEDLTSASPAPENYSWSSPTYSVGGAETSSLTVGSQAITSVSLTNRASTVPLGTFQVKQTASGADVAANKEFGFIYDCSDGHFALCGGLTRLVEGTAHEVFVIKRLYGHRRISFSLKSVG